MNDIINIPLNKLTAWEGNVRKTQNKASLDELAASIKAHGLLQSLVVRKDGKKYAVVAGSRRLAALTALQSSGDITPAFEVPCQVIEKDADATELSLAENAVREDMHPADQFEAFRELIDKGKSLADVAAAFGITEAVVIRRLKLARVSPVILAAYRAEKLDLEQVMAFAISDDHAAQEHVYKNLRPHGRDWRTIRDALTENEISAKDKRVKFVTLKAYEKAGGSLKRDLFSDDEDNVFITDTSLLETLVTAKLEKAATALRKEGWKWTETRIDFDYGEKSKFQRLYPEKAPLPEALETERENLQTELDKLDADYRQSEDDAEYPDRAEDISKRLEEIEDSREANFTPEQRAITGAVVYIDYNGKAEIERGLGKPEDMPQKTGKTSKASNTGDAEPGNFPALSAALIESMTAEKSAAIAASLKDAPALALASVVYTMALGIFGHRFKETALKVSASSQSLTLVEGSTAFKSMEEAREGWGNTIPGDADALWQWCLIQDTAVLLDLLAFCAACTVNAVQGKMDKPDNDRLEHAGKLAAELKLDMKAWFTPTAENYYNRIGKPQIIAALQEVDATMPSTDMKKAALATYAEQVITGKGWLPAILR